MAVTTVQLKEALRNWQIACEKVKLQRDQLKAFLIEQRDAIESWELRLDKENVNVDTKDYMDTLHKPGNAATFDQELQEAIEHMHARRAEFIALEDEFRRKQSKV